MRRRIIFVLFTAIAGCTTPQILVSPELKNDGSAFVVKGRQGFQVGRTLYFGEYATGKVKQGWVKGYDIPFFVRFQGMNEKLSFQQFGMPGQLAEVYATGKFRSAELPFIRDYFNIVLNEKNHFAGTVVLNGGRDVWEFLLYNPEGETFKNNDVGFMQNRIDRIEVKGIKTLLEGKNFSGKFFGYEFILNGNAIGAVETINKGKVWIKDDLPDDLKLVLASLSSSLLMRTNLEERIE